MGCECTLQKDNTHEAEDIGRKTDNPEFQSNNVVSGSQCVPKKNFTVLILWLFEEFNAVTHIKKKVFKNSESTSFIEWFM